jgi:hypothetical protein
MAIAAQNQPAGHVPHWSALHKPPLVCVRQHAAHRGPYRSHQFLAGEWLPAHRCRLLWCDARRAFLRLTGELYGVADVEFINTPRTIADMITYDSKRVGHQYRKRFRHEAYGPFARARRES